GHAPPGVLTTLQTYVFHLRRALDPQRAPGAPARVVIRRDPGYMLQVVSESVDSLVFESALAAGRAAYADRDFARAAEILRSASGLWRGDALADLADYQFARAEGSRLDDLRLMALETRIDAELALGRHSLVAVELDALIEANPLRERFCEQLIL